MRIRAYSADAAALRCILQQYGWPLAIGVRMPKIRDVIRRLEHEGWLLSRMRGDHRQYKHPDRRGAVVTIAGHPSDDIPPGTWNSIQKQASWKEETRE